MSIFGGIRYVRYAHSRGPSAFAYGVSRLLQGLLQKHMQSMANLFPQHADRCQQRLYLRTGKEKFHLKTLFAAAMEKT